MKVKDFIEYLKTLDQEATVQVIQAYDIGGWEGGKHVHGVPFDPKEHFEESDFRSDYFKDESFYGKLEYTFGDKG